MKTVASTGTQTFIKTALAMSMVAAAAGFAMQVRGGPPEAHACIFGQQIGIHSPAPSNKCTTGWQACQGSQAAQPWCVNAVAYENIYQCLLTQVWTQACENSLTGLRNRAAYIPTGFVSPGVPPVAYQGFATLSASSPSGRIVPGTQNVISFNVFADHADDAEVDVWTFDLMTTDNSGNGWNTCSELADTDFSLYNYTTDFTAISLEDDLNGTWALKDGAGMPCGPLNGGSVVEEVALTTASGDIVPAGVTYTYKLYMNTMGASVVDHDALNVDLTAVSPMVADRLPVSGNTLVF